MKRWLPRAALAAAIYALASATPPAGAAAAGCDRNAPLAFRNGEFRVVQFADTQDDQNIEPRTVQLMIAVIEDINPDLVVFSGDNITGGPKSDRDVRKAIDNIVLPLEERGVPFVIIFGNHDEDSYNGVTVKWREADQYRYYQSFSCNRNPNTAPFVTGDSNFVVPVYGSDGNTNKPVLAVWGLDSGRYAPNPDEIAGQKISWHENTWDYIRQDQVDWYVRTSKQWERRHGAKIPGLMFIHIPLFEHATMWNTQFGQPWPNDTAGVANPVIPPGTSQDPFNPDYDRYGMRSHAGYGQNERHECVCTGPYNSGLFVAVRERGDVKGIFCGHDHINTYYGNYHGVVLGYAGSAGFGTYGLSGAERNRLKGARVFRFKESNPWVFETEMKFAGADYGLCIKPRLADCPGYGAAKTDSDEPDGAALAAAARLRGKAGEDAPELEIKDGRPVGFIIRN